MTTEPTVHFGYDPGGNDCHGVASVFTDDRGGPEILSTTRATAADAFRWCRDQLARYEPTRVTLGVDTLTLWSTAASGYRPADRALRAAYPKVKSSVVAPNSLFGSMPINGLSVAALLRRLRPDIQVTETHPKVLFFALRKQPYDYQNARPEMVKALAAWLETTPKALGLSQKHEHQWEALVSAFAARQWGGGVWTNDLHALRAAPGEQLVAPIGRTPFAWPAALAPHDSVAVQPRGARPTWQDAVDALNHAGHPEAARAVAGYQNAKGNHGGWDAWFRRVYADLEPFVFGDE